MPSTASPLFGLELQADGENLNAWGQLLNTLFKHLEHAISSFPSIAVEADVTLTSTDYVDNQSRRAGYILTGTGGHNIICPAKSRKYLVKNNCTSAVTFTHNAGGTDVVVAAGAIKWIATDGTDFFTPEELDFLPLAGGALTGALLLAGEPTDALHPATKAYADALAFNAIDLPGQSGNSGKFLTTDGANAGWGDALADDLITRWKLRA